MSDFSFYVLGPAELGSDQIRYVGTFTVGGPANVMVVTDDDTVLDDETAGGFETRDFSQQFLQSAFGGVPAGNIVQSVYRNQVFNQTTGQTGFDYTIRMYSGSDPANPGVKTGDYYHAFSIAVSQGDVLVYSGSGTSVGQVSYASLFSPVVPSVLSINSVIAAEGSTGGVSPFTFTVTRDTTNGSPTATYTITNISTDAADFGAGFVSTGTVTFAANSLTATIVVPVAADRVIESTESFRVTLSNGSAGVTFANAVGTGTITDDDFDPNAPRYQVSNGISPTTLTGGGGNDTYVVSNPQTTIIDGPNGGNDTVFVSTLNGLTSYALNGGAFIETISAADQRGTDTLNLTGNFYAQTIVGNFGNNVLNGNGGADTLIGLRGDDTYAISDASAVIVEQPGEGYDRVYASVSYTLTGTAAVEELGFTNQGASDNLNLIGNAFDQKIVGNYGNNVLNGNGGVDTLIGLLGDDTYVIGDRRSVVVENSGEGFDTVFVNTTYQLAAGSSIEVLSTATQGGNDAYNLVGNEFAQKIIGNNGDNFIDGGAGADTLIGLGGRDTFYFSTPLGNGNVDTIVDFQVGSDTIALSATYFDTRGLLSGVLRPDAFINGTAASGSFAQIVYNQATGQIFYDADGSGSGAAVLFATVTPGTALTSESFRVLTTAPTI